MLGSTAFMCAFKLFWESFKLFLMDNISYVLIYAFLSAFISFCMSYRFGPVSHPKTIDLMQWVLQVMIG